MPVAHIYIFSDACPTDWLIDGHDDDWHTIVNLVFQTDPALQVLVAQGQSHETVLPQDAKYTNLISDLQAHLPSGLLRKWSTGPGYRDRFCKGFVATHAKHRPIISACSFQERILRDSKDALLNSYNRLIGGTEGRGIGFAEHVDGKGRRQMKHSFVNFHGHNEIKAPVNQMLVLLLMSWFVADQFVFFANDIVQKGRHGFDGLSVTIVSDKLSGDDDFRAKSEANLRNLIDPENVAVPIVLTRSRLSDTFSGDLLVDNLAGWLTSVMNDGAGKFADYARSIAQSGLWDGWRRLVLSRTALEAVPVMPVMPNDA